MNSYSKTTFYWRDLKLLVTPSSHLSKDYIVNQMSSIVGGISNKIEDHIERSHQVGKRLERKCQCVTDFAQSQTSQIKSQNVLSNPILEIKLDQVKEETLSLIVKDNITILICKLNIVITL